MLRARKTLQVDKLGRYCDRNAVSCSREDETMIECTCIAFPLEDGAV